MLGAGFKGFVVGLLAITAALFVTGWAQNAAAAGSVKLASAAVDEEDGTWLLKFTIDYGKVPHVPHVSMVFSFKQTAVYKRVLTDETGDKPVERTERVTGAEPNNVPVDVGFSNAKGEMFPVTKFKIKLRRQNDFEAGEYELTVKEADGRQIGGKVKVVLRGKNKVINYKAMNFEAPPPKPKPEQPKDDGQEDKGPMAAEDMGPDLSDIPDDTGENTGDDDPGKVPPKQGGCGCEVPGRATPARPGWGVVALGVALATAASRRRWGTVA